MSCQRKTFFSSNDIIVIDSLHIYVVDYYRVGEIGARIRGIEFGVNFLCNDNEIHAVILGDSHGKFWVFQNSHKTCYVAANLE